MQPNILERGRHTKVHVVLAAQNPTQRNIKVDLSNAAARIAFKCSKRDNADTIIEGCGAENLSGQGDMYLSFPGRDLQRLQGIYITRRKLVNTLSEIFIKWIQTATYTQRFTIPDVTIQEQRDVVEFPLSQCASDELFANVAYYTLGVETVSANELRKVFHISWDRADDFMKELCRMGTVSAVDGKLRRRVLVQRFEDVSAELMNRMTCCNITHDDVRSKIETRTRSANTPT